jgi:hypothetical protein
MNRDNSCSIMEMPGDVLIDDTPVFDRTSPNWTHSFLRLITLNIWCGRYSNLIVAIHTMHQMRVDLGILMETKIDNNMYDNFRMNTRSGRYGAAYNMVGLRCLNEELSLLPKNPTEAKLQATSTRGESTEPT